MKTVLITGGSGLVGKRLTTMLVEKGYKVIIAGRQKKYDDAIDSTVRYAVWDIDKKNIGSFAISEANYIIHLAGAGVADKRWTAKRKQEIVDSRTKSSALLVQSLTAIPNTVEAVVSASAIGWYGADTGTNNHGFVEEDIADDAFLGNTCRLWEESINPVTTLDKRLVKLRIGIVLSKDGGALKEFMKPLKFGLATILGSGNQVISWIHIDDLCRMFIAAIEQKEMNGVYNAVAPKPVTNQYLTLALAKQMRGNFFIPVYVPSFVLKLMLGEMSVEILKSATVSCNKIKTAGFTFLYPAVETALQQILEKR